MLSPLTTLWVLLFWNLTRTASALLGRLSLFHGTTVDQAPKGAFSRAVRSPVVANSICIEETNTRTCCLLSHGSTEPSTQGRKNKTSNQILQKDPFRTSSNSKISSLESDRESDSSNTVHANAKPENNLDYSKIRKGEIYIQEDFLTRAQVDLLRKDIAELQQHDPSAFQPSGLSNRVEGDRNEFGSSDRLTCTITPDLPQGKQSRMRLVVEEKLEDLKQKLQTALSLQDPLRLELAELYYSASPRGSHLPRHQDEKHEETKGSKGWISDTRRSISWLIYLNEDGWGERTTIYESNDACKGKVLKTATTTISSTARHKSHSAKDLAGSGGELRAYVRKCCAGAQCGSHDGNIQVGWLRIEEDSSPLLSSSSSSSTNPRIEYEPIFLDSWVKTRTETSDTKEEEDEYNYNGSLEWQAMSALYRLQTEKPASEEGKSPLDENLRPLQKVYLSPPFGSNSPSWPSDLSLNDPSDFDKALKLQLSNLEHQRQFVGVQDIRDSEIVDVLPTGGTLVLFDSVTVPHEVLETTLGTRLAIAGWFHEPQQDFPEWYGT